MEQPKITISLILIMLLTFVASISLVSADVSCDRFFVSNEEPTVTSSNLDPNNSIQISTIGSYFDVNKNSLGGGEGPVDLEVSFEDNVQPGSLGVILFDNSQPIEVKYIEEDEQEEEPEDTTGCRLITLPHTTSFRIEQGKTGSSSVIRIKASSQCPDLAFNVVETSSMNKPMYIDSMGETADGKGFEFSIGLDAVDIETGSYSNTYIVSGEAGDKTYTKDIRLETIVTQGTSPITNETFSSLPSCSLEGDMMINKTYSLICQNKNPNIKIQPQSNELYIGKSVSESGGQFEYEIKPVKVGNTKFKALFTYRGVPVGQPYTKDIRIGYGNLPQKGTSINVNFYQDGKKTSIDKLKAGETKIVPLDENTKSPLEYYDILLNGNEINRTFKLKNDLEYELIISSPGYISKNLNFSVTEKPKIEIKLSEGELREGKRININTTPENASLFLDGTKLNNNFIQTSAGNHTIKAIYEGYEETEKNITIEPRISLTFKNKWKKNKQQNFTITEETDWKVYYRKDRDSELELIAEGNGTSGSFKPKDKGIYHIYLGDEMYTTREIEGISLFGWINWWYLLVIIIVGIIIIVVLYIKNNSGGTYIPPSMDSISDGEELQKLS
ncbi:MAG: PEGA domain-containing protein [Candidatus Nanoarchaeia archaeon]